MGKNPTMTGAPLSRILPLHTGHYTMPATDARFPDDRIIVRAFLIEHPHGLFLMDTGFSPDDTRAIETFAPVHIRPIRSVLVEQGDVFDRPRQGTGRVQRRAERQHAIGADPADGGLQAGDLARLQPAQLG